MAHNKALRPEVERIKLLVISKLWALACCVYTLLRCVRADHWSTQSEDPFLQSALCTCIKSA